MSLEWANLGDTKILFNFIGKKKVGTGNTIVFIFMDVKLLLVACAYYIRHTGCFGQTPVMFFVVVSKYVDAVFSRNFTHHSML